MKKTVNLADVLWTAANTHLQSGAQTEHNAELYSCAAVSLATGNYSYASPAKLFMRSLGCDTCSTSLLHPPWKTTAKLQGVRYMWLLLAMHVAEDEGIEIEVTQ